RPVGATRRTVPQKGNRRWRASGPAQVRVKRCGKSAPASRGTSVARETPPGAGPRVENGLLARLSRGRVPQVGRSDGWPPKLLRGLDRIPPTGRLTVNQG